MGFGVRQLGLDPGSSTDKLVRLRKEQNKTKKPCSGACVSLSGVCEANSAVMVKAE